VGGEKYQLQARFKPLIREFGWRNSWSPARHTHSNFCNPPSEESTGIKTRISIWRRQQCKTGCKTCACCRNASANVQMLLLLTFAPARFAARPIHAAVGFSNNVKGCYVPPLQQVWPCFCARFEVAQLPNSWISIVLLVRPHAPRLVHLLTSGWAKSTLTQCYVSTECTGVDPA
jgi:hypothetical protein